MVEPGFTRNTFFFLFLLFRSSSFKAVLLRSHNLWFGQKEEKHYLKTVVFDRCKNCSILYRCVTFLLDTPKFSSTCI